MEKLKFYDMKLRKAFESDEYKIEMRGKTRMAVATGPSGIKAYRIMAK
jgi:hypothetical protein